MFWTCAITAATSVVLALVPVVLTAPPGTPSPGTDRICMIFGVAAAIAVLVGGTGMVVIAWHIIRNDDAPSHF